MNGDLAPWIAARTPIPALSALVKTAGRKPEHFRLALKNGDATTLIAGWLRCSGGTLTLCVDGAAVDKPTPLREQLRQLWVRGAMRKVSDPAFGRFVGVVIQAMRERVTADPAITRIEIVGTQIASPHLAGVLRELGLTTDVSYPTVPNGLAWGIAAGGIALGCGQLAEPTLSGLVSAIAVVLAGGLTIAKVSSMRGSYAVERLENRFEKA